MGKSWKVFSLLLIVCLASAAAADDGIILRRVAPLPFEYFAYPTTVIGNVDGAHGTEVTPEGYLFTGSMELMFFVGPDCAPLDQRVKTLAEGYLPIVGYSTERDGVRYEFECFANTMDTTKPGGPLINFVQVKLRNVGGKTTTACLKAALRGGAKDHRVRTSEFTTDWMCVMENDHAIQRTADRDFILCTYDPAGANYAVQDTLYHEPFRLADRGVEQTTLFAIWEVKMPLLADEEATYVFKFPWKPLPIEKLQALREANCAALRKKTREDRRLDLAQGQDIMMPEDEALNTLKASLFYLLIARDVDGDNYVQRVNEFQDDSFSLRDAAFMVRAYDVCSRYKDADKCIRYFLKLQQPNGLFTSQHDDLGEHGLVLWAIGQHYEMSRDNTFVQDLYPAVKKAVAWLKQARAKTKTLEGLAAGLLPKSLSKEGVAAEGYSVENDLWAYLGLKYAKLLADAWVQPADAADFERELTDYRSSILRALYAAAAQGSECDLTIIRAVYPCGLLDPMDPLVSSALQMLRQKCFNEGLMTYKNTDTLHGYLGADVAQVEILRGEQKQALDHYYAMLAHTTATRGGFETASASTRDFGDNLAPNGVWAAKFLELTCGLLTRSEGNVLHFGPCIPPAWSAPGRTLFAVGISTPLAMASYKLHGVDGGADLEWMVFPTGKPEKMIFHAPYGHRLDAYKLGDGDWVAASGNQIELQYEPNKMGRMDIKWTRLREAGEVGYQKALARIGKGY